MRLIGGLFATLLALSACVPDSREQAAAACMIEPSAVTPWSLYHTIDEKPLPNVFVYEGCGRRLVYVAAAHSNDPASETYGQLRAAMKKWPPKFVVLEGFPASMGENPTALVEHAASVAGSPSDAEPFEAVRLAMTLGAPFVGGEPDDSELLAGMQAAGLSAVDLAGFYALRQIDQWAQSQEIADHRDPALDGLIRELVSYVARDAGIDASEVESVATRAGLAAWYEKINGIPFDASYRPEDSHPTGPVNNRPTNALSDRISDIRDQTIVKVIAGALEGHGEVLVVYGGSHHTIQAPALESAFGEPTFAGKLAH